MGLQAYFSVLARRWISIAVFALLGVLFAVGVTVTSPKSYQARAQSFVALTSGSDDSALQGAQFAAQRVKSYTLMVTSPDVLEPVIGELDLQTTVSQLAEQVSAENPSLTVLLEVVAANSNPELSAEIATAVAVQLGKVIERLETPNAASVPPVKVTLIDPATVPASPSSPRAALNLILGLVVGLGLGIAWAFVRDSLDNTVKSAAQLEEASGSAALGAVMFDPDASKGAVGVVDSTSPRSEGYRTVRTNLQFVNVDHPPRAITITSAAPGDGKTTTSANFAIALAMAGYTVCVVEADLRRPHLAEMLGITPSSGLTDAMAGTVELDAVIEPWQRGLLSVVASGPIPPNPSELLGSGAMARIIKDLRARFDYVIIDAPPLLAVADAAILAAATDGAIIVARFGKSTRDQVRAAGEALSRVGADNLGSILNAVPQRKHPYPSPYGYGYGYGYKSKTDNEAEASNGPVIPTPASGRTAKTTTKSD